MAVTLSPSGLTLGSTTVSDWADVGGGKVLQVVSAVTGTQTSTTSTSYTNTALSQSITPSSTSSKILAIASMPVYSQTGSNTGAEHRVALWRDTSVNITSGVNGTREANGFFDYVYSTAGLVGLDSPATTSAVTYRVRIRTNHTATTVTAVPSSLAASAYIVLMEIGA